MRQTMVSKNKIRMGLTIVGNKISYVVLSHIRGAFNILEQAEYETDEWAHAIKKINKQKPHIPCYVALPHKDFIIKTLGFSGLNAKEIRALLDLNAEKYFSNPASSIYYDFEYICQSTNKLRIVAAKKQYVETVKKTFETARLNLMLISLDILAFENFFRYHSLFSLDKVYGVFIHWKEELLQMVVINGRIFSINSVSVTHQTSDFFYEEIIKFFNVYESNASFMPMTHVFLLESHTSFFQDIKIKLPVVRINLENNTPLQDMVSIGVALG